VEGCGSGGGSGSGNNSDTLMLGAGKGATSRCKLAYRTARLAAEKREERRRKGSRFRGRERQRGQGTGAGYIEQQPGRRQQANKEARVDRCDAGYIGTPLKIASQTYRQGGGTDLESHVDRQLIRGQRTTRPPMLDACPVSPNPRQSLRRGIASVASARTRARIIRWRSGRRGRSGAKHRLWPVVGGGASACACLPDIPSGSTSTLATATLRCLESRNVFRTCADRLPLSGSASSQSTAARAVHRRLAVSSLPSPSRRRLARQQHSTTHGRHLTYQVIHRCY
jgi:hypothetical protein